MKFLKSVYIKTISLLVQCLLFLSSKLMKHYLLLQNLDPSFTQYDKLRQQLIEQMELTEYLGKQKDYDDDFEVKRFYERMLQKHHQFDLTFDDFKNKTCLDHIDDMYSNTNSSEVNQ